MRSLAFALAAGLVLAGLHATTAHAADPPAAARQEWSIRAVANSRYVTTEISKVGADASMLRARGANAGAWERYTLHNANDSDGSTFSIKSLANGKFVTVEANYPGAYQGLLRARSDSVGAWERFRLEDGGDSDPTTVAIWSFGAARYVTTEVNAAGEDAGMLRARSTTVGGWERFVLTDLTAPPPPTTDQPTPSAGTVSVMSWNVCAANNAACDFFHTPGGPMASAVATQATSAGFAADAVLLQEVCETHAPLVEQELERRSGRAWSVRFAPSYERLPNLTPVVLVQKACQRDTAGAARGSFGIALAVPAENAWYHWYPLPSPPATVASPQEQRVAVCATVESRKLHVCAAHFSAGHPTLPPADDFRPEQAQALLQRVAKSGYTSIFGGDLNLSPPDDAEGDEPKSALVPLYAAYEECDQSAHGGARDGRPTFGSLKLDYVFGPPSATFACRVGATGQSDHEPIFATVSIP
ncbi:endonuclease/exonuclease/phosphatase family protein [Tenggerimyces flavus]|uniref:Endonuclease/exonuclease/phosphatase family protein n=1 Tax=Tenggerimyces flavus TaxID=1708749 RepID=A0ABV7YDU4_9ACTN|nr:endonuclease/exonuclease/phosphatase family metal-dependent hydrolase [Tenggerimyces flavus]